MYFRNVSNFNHTLSAILRGEWMLDIRFAVSHLPIVAAMLDGKPVSFSDRTGSEEGEAPFAIDPATMTRYELYKWDNYGNRVPNPNIPANSVGIMPLTGPITKYNGDCGEPGMIQREKMLNDMLRRDSIGSIIQLIDTPGGEVSAAHNYSQLLLSSKKPILSLVDDMCCSLGMWFTSPSMEVYATHDLCEIGSIGTYCTYADFTEYYAKMGIKLIEVYAPQSEDKNKAYRDLLAGLPEGRAAVQESLKRHTDKFISFVANNRGAKAQANIDQWSTGKVFNADEAIKLGLIDGIKSLEQVVMKAAWLAKRAKN